MQFIFEDLTVLLFIDVFLLFWFSHQAFLNEIKVSFEYLDVGILFLLVLLQYGSMLDFHVFDLLPQLIVLFL